MRCPICQDKDHLVVDVPLVTKALGTVKGCGCCGAVWSRTNQEVSMLAVPRVSYTGDRIPSFSNQL